MECLPARLILIVAISNTLEVGCVAGSDRHELAPSSPSLGDLALTMGSHQSQEKEPAIRSRPPSSQFVPSMRIQDSRELNRSCCHNGGTCMLGLFCFCPPSFSGRNCEHDLRIRRSCGSVPHDTWLPKRCSICKCWQGEMHCVSQAFLPGCEKQGGHVTNEHLLASRTPGSSAHAGSTLMLAGTCLAVQFLLTYIDLF
ncbi:teratocarcinoma-derived growth factor 1 [Ochotona princeps]|uniref:teratocarcinoma-derived growth factor 1 n=1 Tax=Ochotona princeps TaxID=9978 RepID=UPI002714D1C1|nr:teratocarcinoma-derived growth factor 1 [Ochotona princeps]